MNRPADFSTVPSLRQNKPWKRLFYLGLSVGILILLIIASRLEPNASGMGTHQQLGLPPCSMVFLYGIRCPACGMTTSWAHFTHGDIRAALDASVGGTLLAMFGLISVPTAAWKSFRGGPLSNRAAWTMAVLLMLLLAITLIDWFARIA